MTVDTNQLTVKEKEDLSWLKWYLSALTKQYIIVNSLKDTISQLQAKHDSIDLTPKTEKELAQGLYIPASSNSSDYDFEFDEIFGIGLVGCVALSILVGLFFAMVLGNFIEGLLLAAKWIFGIYLALWIIGFVLNKFIDIAFELSSFLTKFSKKKKREAQERRDNLYHLLEIRKLEEQHRITMLRKQKMSISKDIEECKKSVEAANDMLEDLYKIDVIHKKYRKFDAIYKFYDYFSTERCYELTGPFGAYNLYEHELKEEEKIKYLSYLPTISEQLFHIHSNQLFLADQIATSQRTMDAIYQEALNTNRIEQDIFENSKLATYYSKQIADNTKTMQNLMIYEKRIKGDISGHMTPEEFKNIY